MRATSSPAVREVAMRAVKPYPRSDRQLHRSIRARAAKGKGSPSSRRRRLDALPGALANAAAHSVVVYWLFRNASDTTTKVRFALFDALSISMTKSLPTLKSHFCLTVVYPASSSCQAIHSAHSESADVEVARVAVGRDAYVAIFPEETDMRVGVVAHRDSASSARCNQISVRGEVAAWGEGSCR